jgi:hypothetical protein
MPKRPVAMLAAAALRLAGCGSRSGLFEAEEAPFETTTETPGTMTETPGTATGTGGPCDVPDADGDEHDAIDCGGDDCDDQDATIHPGAPDNAAGQWTLSTVAPGPGTFRSVALALDAAGQPRLAYAEKGETDLHWAEPSGAGWKTEVVKDAWSGPTRSVSLALDATGAAHISYAAGGLRRAFGAPGAWQAEMIDPTVGTNYFATSIAAADGALHIAYRQVSSIRYARQGGAAWTIVSIAPNGSASGADVSIGLDAGNAVHISYESVAQGMFGTTVVRYATNTGGDFQIEDIDTFPAGLGQTYDALAVSPEGLVHIAYRDGSQKALRLATGKSGSWARETVDASDDAGAHASIALDGSGAAHIAYHAAGTGELRHATNKGGKWVIEPVDASGDTGLYTSVKVGSAGQVHIGYVDAGAQAVRHATSAAVMDGIDQDCDGHDG